ncbi:polyketide synthase [Haematococcus lacustris]
MAADPQHRLLLEGAAELLPAALAANTRITTATAGVFVGISWCEYHQLSVAHGVAEGPYAAQGAVLSMACGRLSYTWSLSGPSLSVDTACSSSLVATHLACTHLASQQQHIALTAGANTMLLPGTTAMFNQASMLAPDARCKALDASADGYVRAEGLVMALLASHEAAQARATSSLPVLAVLAGSAVNQDGRSSSLTAPHGPSQQAVMMAALAAAGADLDSVCALQMHGTGKWIAGVRG